MKKNALAVGKPNYYGVGDSSQTEVDLELLQCWNCSEVWFMEGVDWEDFYPYCKSKEEALRESVETTLVERGRKKI